MTDLLDDPPPLAPCTWTETDSGPYDTTCGNMFAFDDDPPHPWMKFCPYCGSPVTFIPYAPPPEEAES